MILWLWDPLGPPHPQLLDPSYRDPLAHRIPELSCGTPAVELGCGTHLSYRDP